MASRKLGDFLVAFEHNYDDSIRKFIPIGTIKNKVTGEEGSIITVRITCESENEADRLVVIEAKRRIIDNNWRA